MTKPVMLKDMSAEEIKAIIDALVNGEKVEYLNTLPREWVSVNLSRDRLHLYTYYRIAPKPKKQLVISWQFIKPEYEWRWLKGAGRPLRQRAPYFPHVGRTYH